MPCCPQFAHWRVLGQDHMYWSARKVQVREKGRKKGKLMGEKNPTILLPSEGQACGKEQWVNKATLLSLKCSFDIKYATFSCGKNEERHSSDDLFLLLRGGVCSLIIISFVFLHKWQPVKTVLSHDCEFGSLAALIQVSITQKKNYLN